MANYYFYFYDASVTVVSPLVPCPAPISALVSGLWGAKQNCNYGVQQLDSPAAPHLHTAALQHCRGMLPQPAAKCSPVSRCRTQSLQMVFTADTDLTHNNVRFNILELLIKDINYKIISGRPFLDWMKGFQHPAALLGIIQLYKHCIWCYRGWSWCCWNILR